MAWFSQPWYRVVGLLTVTLSLVGVTAMSQPAQATVRQDRVVSDNPVNWTPHALDGSVRAIAQVGNTIVSGGDFTRIADRDQLAEIPQGRVFAFDATTGEINQGFRPQITGGMVEAVAAHPDGTKVWVAGDFTTVNGVNWPKLVLLNLSDGSIVTSFPKAAVDGKIRDLAVANNRLIVGGTFKKIKGVTQGHLAALKVANGAYDPFLSLPFAGVNNGGTTAVAKFDVSNDGSKLVAIGNFATVAGQARQQVAVINLTGSSATLASWATARFGNVCANAFDTYLRDVDIDPDGSYFVVASTGAYRSGTLCDSASRWELGTTGTGLQPTWINYTGGDTLYSVAVTGPAVYVGGHQRWHNNSFRGDSAGPGAVAREGIAALDPLNGVPLSWNPGRDRGVGAFALVATTDGLWVGSDTDRLGRWEFHGRLGMFPVLGGKTVPRPVTGSLPGRLLSLGTGAAPFVARTFDGTTAGAPASVPGTATAAKAATMISSQLYLARANGNLEVASWDGTALGAPAVVPDLGITAWRTDVANMTGMYFRAGRLYYTVSGGSNLYYRYFSPESGVIGAERFNASASVAGLSYSTVRSMFHAGNTLYWVESTGNLKRTTTVNGIPAANATTTVSGPAQGIDWRQGPLVLEAFAEATPPNATPVASAEVVCEGLTCHFTSAGSQDPDGQLVERVWDFGDGTFGEGASIDHTYADEGPYQVKLTIRDEDAAEASKTITASPDAAPVAVLDVTCDGLTCTLDGTASTDASKPAIGHTWDTGDGGSKTGATATHTYAAPGTYPVTLTVRDDEGNTTAATENVRVVANTSQIEFVQGATATTTSTTVRVTTPTATTTGDGLVLITSGNRADVTYGDPGAGWTEVRRITDTDLVTIVWQKVAEEADAGKQITLTASAATKVNAQLLVYRGTDRTAPVLDSAAAVEAVSTAAHVTPTIQAPQQAMVVSYWADKSSTTTQWTPPESGTSRGQTIGTGSGRVTSLVADLGPVAEAGEKGGLTATADAASAKATMLTLVLAPRS